MVSNATSASPHKTAKFGIQTQQSTFYLHLYPSPRFSFVHLNSGAVKDVFYPDEESLEVINLKKGLVGMLSTQTHPDVRKKREKEDQPAIKG